MSKVVIYVLDKIVWMLLITAVTTQALQIVGVVDTPKGLSEITYKQDNEYNFQVQVGGADPRGKRQVDHRSQFIDNIFNIPISTLNAVNQLVQNTRPAFQNLREYAARGLDRANQGPGRTNQLKEQTDQTVNLPNSDGNVKKQ